VGTDPDVDVDGFTIEAEDGDIFLICSDGLTDMVEDEEILELVHRNRDDLDKAVESLVAAANRGGGEDNITAVAFRIVSEGGISLEDTVAMPAIAADGTEPDEQTREYGEELRAGDTMVVPPDEIPDEVAASDGGGPKPVANARRVRFVLIALALLAVAAALVAWWLLR
jgi:hypothetical protein